MNADTDYLGESRNAVAMLNMLYVGNVKGADQCLAMVEDHAKYVAALHALSVQFLHVIDRLAIAAGLPHTNAVALLGQLRDQMAMSEGIEI
jgi:hypothetical protein